MSRISFRRVALRCVRAPQGASLCWMLILPEPLGEPLDDGFHPEAPRSLGIFEVHFGAHGLPEQRTSEGRAIGENAGRDARVAVAEEPVGDDPAVPVHRLEGGLGPYAD